MKNKIVYIGVHAVVFLSICLSSAHAVTLRTNQSKVRVIALPGEAQAGSIEVENPSEATLIVKVFTEDWKYTAVHDGSKDFLPAGTTGNSCAEWISFFPPEFILTPFSKQKVNYTVKTPKDLLTGHYAVLFFQTSIGKPDLKEGVGMNVNIRIGTLFYVEPKGLTRRQAECNDFSVRTKPEDSSLQITFDLKNTGNIDIMSFANFNLIDKKGIVYARGLFNDTYTFPDESASLNASWKEPIPAGRYDLVITLDLGKALEDAGLGRGPVLVKEASVEIDARGYVVKVSPLQ